VVTWFAPAGLPVLADELGGAAPGLGAPLANTQVYLLDEARQPVLPGAIGEIYIGGVGVGRGYINDQDLTAERFVPDPFADGGPPSRLYRTGDLARLAPDGNLEFIGRVDHEVKIRGMRVHLGDVEANLRQCPGVREAVVLKKPFGPDDDRLVAYVVPAASPAPAGFTDELRLSLRERLPEHMVPAGLVVLERLPLNPNGKIDRPALLSLAEAGDGRRAGGRVPGTELEQAVVGICADALKVGELDMNDDFFDVGGDSLKAVLVVADVANRLGISVPLEALFETRTIGGFCERVAAARSGE
jgi:acyl-coenzyme A synthetase/AMP-(fatty) acid ligase/acyl carrier protein